jgi:16S rRNA (cytidine1402-2'-O)-methyltransferase
VLYESPLRVGATLADLAEVLGADRRACVARELTKPHEEIVRDSLGGLAERYATQRPLGEVTLVVAGSADGGREDIDDDELLAKAQRLIAEGQSTSDAARALAELTGRPRRDVYKLITSAREP